MLFYLLEFFFVLCQPVELHCFFIQLSYFFPLEAEGSTSIVEGFDEAYETCHIISRTGFWEVFDPVQLSWDCFYMNSYFCIVTRNPPNLTWLPILNFLVEILTLIPDTCPRTYHMSSQDFLECWPIQKNHPCFWTFCQCPGPMPMSRH